MQHDFTSPVYPVRPAGEPYRKSKLPAAQVSGHWDQVRCLRVGACAAGCLHAALPDGATEHTGLTPALRSGAGAKALPAVVASPLLLYAKHLNTKKCELQNRTVFMSGSVS